MDNPALIKCNFPHINKKSFCPKGKDRKSNHFDAKPFLLRLGSAKRATTGSPVNSLIFRAVLAYP